MGEFGLSGDGGLVDPEPVDRFSEDSSFVMVRCRGDVDVVGVASSGEGDVDAAGVGWAVEVEDGPVDGSDIDLNQVVSYNIRAARELRGWTQEDLAARLEVFLGTRPTQATISAIERAWDGDRRREFDVQDVAVYAMAFDLPIVWFFLPPAGDHRAIQGLNRTLDDLYLLLLGHHHQLDPIYERLRALGIDDPTPTEEKFERVTGRRSQSREWSYKERRKDLLLALLDEHADDLDQAADKLGEFFDHLRQVGIKGFVAENTFDDDFITKPEHRTKK